MRSGILFYCIASVISCLAGCLSTDVQTQSTTAATLAPKPPTIAWNKVPGSVTGQVAIEEDTVFTGNLNGIDPEGNTLTYTIVTPPSIGTVTMLNPSKGTFVYTPQENVYGSDTFSFKTNDGESDSPIAVVTITINPANDPPVAAPDSIPTNEDTAVTIDYLLNNDSDVDGDIVTLSDFSQPSNGSVTLQQDALVYTPNPDYFGNDQFTYTIVDPQGETSTAAVSINVMPINDSPTATPDAIRTPRNTNSNIAVLANDAGLGDLPLNIQTFSQPRHGIVSLNAGGTITYAPETGYVGPDSFTYGVSDQDGETAIADVSVDVYCPDVCDYHLLISWDPNSEPDITGYNLYHGTVSGVYTDSIWVPNDTSYQFTTTVTGTHFFAVSAVNSSGIESSLSDEVSITIPAS